MSGPAVERCAVAVERASALCDLLIAHMDGEDRVAVIALDTLRALLQDAESELLKVEREVRHA